ncbi:hypothetical protein K227x_37620 [Rubripirellula lacrimiformis]|uniref:Probable inorganic carbon transporter subunit DabA n=1 Tax=Rubripirellula lacrimiformis TaxID=1930273 RepID=A0A517NE17_9BACT|nr:DUF2309 domain-containing protein [Rubripirellula lacrimiformis]QDT05362.1 hypothetical protein K227x_37620 [Rubripirellula lacrimiformis]
MPDGPASVTASDEPANDTSPTVAPCEWRSRLETALEHATHYLPAQGPISVFVHHNTLHSFEDLPFEEAVVVGGSMYDCQPYLIEERFREALHSGRIRLQDLQDVLLEDLADGADALIASFGTRYTLRLAMLQMPPHAAPDAELEWLLAESELLRTFNDSVSNVEREQMMAHTRNWVLRHRNSGDGQTRTSGDVVGAALGPADQTLLNSLLTKFRDQKIDSWSTKKWESFVLTLMWEVCKRGVEKAGLAAPITPHPLRLRDMLLEATGTDTDNPVQEILIRFCGVFLDQGFAGLSLPDREAGFAHSFATLYAQGMSLLPSWMRPMQAQLDEILAGDFDAYESIGNSLETLGIDESEQDEYIGQSLLALRGWAGMIWQMETSAPFFPHPAPAGSLAQYLAIQLLLEQHALVDAGRRLFGTDDLREIRSLATRASSKARMPSVQQRAFTVFQLAQTGGWTPDQLVSMSKPQWQRLISEIESFTSLERRRIFHLAYEQQYRHQALDAVAIHAKRINDRKQSAAPKRIPAYQAIFCIDDREESMRRHLEEVDPECQTASAAGFYAVAMYYQGADHAHFRPLCPNLIKPDHYVVEEPLFSSVEDNAKRAKRRHRIGTVTHQVHSGSRTMLGGWITGVFGALATFPMVARILAPRLTSQIREAIGTLTRPPATELHLERIVDQPGQAFDALGYSLSEMASIVVRILQDIGSVKDLPPITVFFGHGSSSLNNPHESAYNCGACSGGRGGPNARAFAMMANDSRVRALVAQQGIELPDDVRFVGAYHNTCNDRVEYYDLDSLPRTHRTLFRRIEASVDEARARNAHERSRRFESAPIDMSFSAALEHVEQRAEDLSQARPEYNHATNALAFVGRREWSRGMYLDRRCFVTSYDPTIDDDDASILARILAAAIPVCAGINLEYYFSTVDVEGYGCGSKLPHNIASMLGVMTGASSDLRPGLSQQMIEIHEPMRILFVIETTPEKMQAIMNRSETINRLVRNGWVQLSVFDAETCQIKRYHQGRFQPYAPTTHDLPSAATSTDWYRGRRDHLGFASVGLDRLGGVQ